MSEEMKKPNAYPDFERQELQDLEERCYALEKKAVNVNWKGAYSQLADALDRLDAMIARSTEKE